MKKRALVTGGNSQDASYLIPLLLEKGLDVYATIRRHGTPESQDNRIQEHINDITTIYCDVIDGNNVNNLIKKIQPFYIFHLAAQSHVGISFTLEEFTLQTNLIGTLHELQAMRDNVPNSRLYFAASSEIFGLGKDADNYQRITSAKIPTSLYGISKLASFNLVAHYRRAYNLFAASGILFNHSSPKRGSNFVESKIIKTAVEIYYGLADRLEIGRDDIFRDFGHSSDYVEAMWRIVNYKEPKDWVISSQEAHSIKEIYEYVFGKLGLDPKKYVFRNEKFVRADELPYLRGWSQEARDILEWKPKYDFYSLLDEILEHYLKLYKNKSKG